MSAFDKLGDSMMVIQIVTFFYETDTNSHFSKLDHSFIKTLEER